MKKTTFVFKPVQTCSNLFKPVQTCSNLFKPVLITLLLLYSTFSIIAQSSSCPNLNTFLNSSSFSEDIPEIHRITEYKWIYLNPIKEDKLEEFVHKFNLDLGTTFQFSHETRSRLDTSEFYRTYQQYYKGIEVEGGGFTAGYIGTGGNPCASITMIAPTFLSNIQLNTNPIFLHSDIINLLGVQDLKRKDLVISHNLSENCQFNVAWRVEYLKDRVLRRAWIDANSGQKLYEVEIISPTINAPAGIYGTKNLKDFTENGKTFLKSPDESIIIKDFKGDCPDSPVDNKQWDNVSIPETDKSVWTTETTEALYQIFYVTSEVKPLFKTLNIDFKKITLMSCTGAETVTSLALEGSTLDNAFIQIGQLNGNSSAFFDIIAHELSHVYLNKFIDYKSWGNRALHEGLSDIIGNYIESLFQKNNDWIMGDDNPVNAAVYDRDLKTPAVNCFTTPSESQPHRRGLAIGYMHYLVSEGNSAEGIPAIGTKKSLDIILESLTFLKKDATAKELMEATLSVAEKKFGRCSNEYLAFARAWELICIPTGQAKENGKVVGCYVKICGQDEVCEELGQINLCSCSQVSTTTKFRWYLLGDKTTEIKTKKGLVGNSQDGGDCLNIISFPKYSYYPQTITIELLALGLNGNVKNSIASKKITIKDCNGNDPKNPCAAEFKISDKINDTLFDKKDASYFINLNKDVLFSKVKIYDLMGKLIYQGANTDNFDYNREANGLLIFVFYDENGIVLEAKKVYKQ